MPRILRLHTRLALAALCLLIGAASPVQRRILLGNPNANLLVGLVGYWPCAEASGTTCADLSGGGHTLTLTGSPTRTTPPNGVTGNALTFNGSNQYATTTNCPFTGNFTGTASVWVNLAVNSTSQPIFAFGASVPALEGFGVFVGVRGTGVVSVEYFGSTYIATTTSPVSVGTPVQITVVKTAGDYSTTTKIYVNGVVQPTSANTTGTPNVVCTTPLNVGRDAVDASGTIENGSNASLRFFSRAFLAGDVSNLYYGRL